MARRGEPRRTKACGEHRPYRTEYEAQVKGAWHQGMPCGDCRRGRIWHIWSHDGHWHCGHSTVRAMAS